MDRKLDRKIKIYLLSFEIKSEHGKKIKLNKNEYLPKAKENISIDFSFLFGIFLLFSIAFLTK